MIAAAFAVPFELGEWVGWSLDGDFGEVTGVIAGQAVAIRWFSTNRIEVYSLFSGAMHLIEREQPEGGDR